MADPVGLRLREGGRIEYYDKNGYELMNGDIVVVEGEFGRTLAHVCHVHPYIPEDKIPDRLKPVLGWATDADWAHHDAIVADEAKALEICREKVEEHGLDMNVQRAIYTDDRSKLIFHFTADERVDFRSLVRDLAAIFHTRIELRQIGVREDAGWAGGMGVCGRELCCASHLRRFEPVSIKMVKEQDVSLNPAKISGHCGRLMCCLNYEYEYYKEIKKYLPKKGQRIRTPEGRGEVKDLDYLRERITVQIEGAGDDGRLIFDARDLGFGRPRDEDEEPEIEDIRDPYNLDAYVEPEGEVADAQSTPREPGKGRSRGRDRQRGRDRDQDGGRDHDSRQDGSPEGQTDKADAHEADAPRERDRRDDRNQDRDRGGRKDEARPRRERRSGSRSRRTDKQGNDAEARPRKPRYILNDRKKRRKKD